MGAGRGQQRRAQSVFNRQRSGQAHPETEQEKLRRELREVTRRVVVGAGVLGVSLALIGAGNMQSDTARPSEGTLQGMVQESKTTAAPAPQVEVPVSATARARILSQDLQTPLQKQVQPEFLSFAFGSNTAVAASVHHKKKPARHTVKRKKRKRHHSNTGNAVHVYKLEVDGLEPLGNASLTSCTGSNGLISDTLLHPYGASTSNMFINPAVYRDSFNVIVNASTKLIATGPYASQVHNICAINESFGEGTYAEPGIFTWKLHTVAKNPGEIVRYPASEAVISTGG